MHRIHPVWIIVGALLAACSDKPDPRPAADASQDMGSDLTDDVGPSNDLAAVADASEEADSSDAGSDCLQVAVTEFSLPYQDDVSIEYGSTLTPSIFGMDRDLGLLFERYGDATYQGTFELGTGADANFGTCAHCVFVRGDNPERAYFADRGTLTLNDNPFSRRADFSMTNLRLIEVGVDPFTRESAVVPDGACIEVADFEAKATFPVNGWTCEDEQYADNMTCNCECGAVDPDCGGAVECLIGDPACTPREELPVVGCDPDQLCVFEPITFTSVCADSCDWAGRSGCTAGTCVFDFGVGSGDLCIADGPRIAPDVALGEDCPSNNLQILCNVVDGFAEGYCGPNGVCRPTCTTDTDCPEADETCRLFVIDGDLGYCGPEPVDG